MISVELTKLDTYGDLICYASQRNYPFTKHFEVFWPVEDRGTLTRIGVLTANLPRGNGTLVCWDQVDEQWVWELPSRKLLPRQFNNVTNKEYPLYPHEVDFVELPETFRMYVDTHEGNVSFRIGEQDLGVAFRGLQGKELCLAFLTKDGVLDNAKAWIHHIDLNF